MSESDLILKNDFDVEFLLIETSHPGYIGACARAIKNMGFNKLGLLNPLMISYSLIISFQNSILPLFPFLSNHEH